MADSDDLGNDPERVEWFRDRGLGLFLHWSVDAQLGAVISHSMVGASPAYLDRYIEELPETFDPTNFDPDAWARLAKVSGFQYVVFATKHHNGFAMWDTDTTDFNVTNTPYGEDIVAEVVDAFRRVNIPIGFYFSPDDFWLLHRQGTPVSRDREEALPTNNPELMEHNLAQIEELFTEYGDVDLLFIDGEPEEIRTLAWNLQPDVVVTRGAMETPEQEIRTEPLDQAWEANLTIGSQWSYKAGNETYKSGRELIETFAETRAKGGNLLLNVGPRPDGSIPTAQEDRVRELGLWNFVNREAVLDVRPCPHIREGNVWFTREETGEPTTIYAFVTGDRWRTHTGSQTLMFESIRATADTDVEILGQSGEVFEYRPDVRPKGSWEQSEDGLQVRVTRAQRLYNADAYSDTTDAVKWSNPPVIRITNARTVREP